MRLVSVTNNLRGGTNPRHVVSGSSGVDREDGAYIRYRIRGRIRGCFRSPGIRTIIGAADSEIPALASDPNSATAWVNSNMVPHYPASKSTLITVGSEVRVTVGQAL